MIIQFRPLNTDLAEQSLANSRQFLTHGLPTFKYGSLSAILLARMLQAWDVKTVYIMESKLTLFHCSMQGVSQRAEKHEDKKELGLMGYTFASTTIPH